MPNFLTFLEELVGASTVVLVIPIEDADDGYFCSMLIIKRFIIKCIENPN